MPAIYYKSTPKPPPKRTTTGGTIGQFAPGALTDKYNATYGRGDGRSAASPVDRPTAAPAPQTDFAQVFADKYKALAEQSSALNAQKSTTAQQGIPKTLFDNQNVHMGNIPTGLQASDKKFSPMVTDAQGRTGEINAKGDFIEAGGASVVTSDDLLTVMPGGAIKKAAKGAVKAAAAQSFREQVAKEVTERAARSAASLANPGERIINAVEKFAKKNKPGVTVKKIGTGFLDETKGAVVKMEVQGKMRQWFNKLFTQIKGNPTTGLFLGAAATGLVTSAVFGGYNRGEADRMVQAAFDDAKFAGDQQGMDDAVALQTEFNNPNFLQTIAEYTPILGNQLANLQNDRAAVLSLQINGRIAADKRLEAGGETEDQKWERIRARRDAEELDLAQRKADIIDISAKGRREDDEASARKLNAEFNASRIEGETAVQEIKASYGREERRADRKAMEESAAFWLEYQKQKLALLEEEREEQARFWLAYKKKVLELEGSSSSGGGRSSLGFGLLR